MNAKPFTKQAWANSSTVSHWLKFLCIFLLVLGICFRFVNLGQKVYWKDEAYTSLWLSGHSRTEIIASIFNGQTLRASDISKYQFPSPNRNALDTVKQLATNDPQHPPLYYLLGWFWLKIFGTSIATLRSLSAFLSLLIFPSLYWLCRELFGLAVPGWTAIALFAVSPFHVLYAQEAREYSLWTAIVVLCSAALLSALRQQTKVSWGVYSLTIVLGFYTCILQGLVVVSHGLYVLLTQGWRLNKTWKAYLASSLIAFVGFLPWLPYLKQIDGVGWTATPIPLSAFIKIWALNLSRLFLDVQFSLKNPLTYLILPILVLVGYSLYFVLRNAPKPTWLFIATLLGVTLFAFTAPDLIGGGRRSLINRYLIPCYIAIQLAVTYLLSVKIFAPKSDFPYFWRSLLAILVGLGIISCATSTSATTWWHKYSSNANPAIARVINQSPHSLVISDSSFGEVLALSHLLEPDVKLRLTLEPQQPIVSQQVIQEFSDVFLLEPSRNFRETLTQQAFHSQRVPRVQNLWHLEQGSSPKVPSDRSS
ncbi:glycosyltransferase family 39 protein [Trichocoleus sp. FACHB-262]|uniref:glycosyltransferase family 39 protein n=1 Tax=Trichocoleus sp. FACHB-262 TaxID=2692869 RepID=UPI0016879226|nr:glycosyltransferase family 39 protein [Trichocoleus sp. FACHB-262]